MDLKRYYISIFLIFCIFKMRSTSGLQTLGFLAPDSPPETNVGSFELSAWTSSVQYGVVSIYWKQIPEEQRNGPNFRYNISLEGNSLIRPSEITNIYAKFEGLSITKSYVFHVWSENINGPSSRTSTIHVPRKFDRVSAPGRLTKLELEAGEYELSWEPPHLPEGQYISNYTIFYCRDDRDRPHQCNGDINWTVVSNDTTSERMKLEKNKIFQFAISANTYNSSSGMVWVDCTLLHNNQMGKMKTVWINSVGSTFIELLWKLTCTDRIGSIEGYIVYYCPIISPTNMDCKGPQKNSTFIGSAISGANLTDLVPYTTYMVTVSVIVKNNTYSPRSDPLYNTTLEAAPSPPSNLEVYSKTDSTITLMWNPPEVLNGKLRYYVLTYAYGNQPPVRVELNTVTYTLENLQGYAIYNITVAACTVSCSESTISVRTEMGYPSKIPHPREDYRNASLIRIIWDLPSQPGGIIDHYTLQFKQKYKYEYKTLEIDTKDNKYLIENCGDGGKYKSFYVSVRAVNKVGEHVYEGPWSEEHENYCTSRANYVSVIYWSPFLGILIHFLL